MFEYISFLEYMYQQLKDNNIDFKYEEEKFKKRGGKKAAVGKNQKVRNATRVEYDGVQFRSKLERYMYQQLKDNNIDFKYEEEKFVLIQSFEYLGEKIRACTYLPDFIVTINGKKAVLEPKGMMTETFKIKIKMIKKYLKDNNLNYPMFLVRNQQQCRDVIQKLKSI